MSCLPARPSSIASEENALLTPEKGFSIDREGPRDECGVFGVYGPGHEVARLA